MKTIKPNYKKNYFVNSYWETLSVKVRRVCYPLFTYLPILYFDYIRLYENHQCAYLSSNYNWIDDFLSHEDYYINPNDFTEGFHLWDSFFPKSILVYAEQKYKYDYGLTYITKTANYIRVVNFCGSTDAGLIPSLCLNDQSLFLTFIDYFEKHSYQLLYKSLRHDIDMFDIPTPVINEDIVRNIHNFLSILNKHTQFTIQVEGKTIPLTRREAQCISGLYEGKSIKMIAKTLGISPRTVECYINKLRRKTQIITKFQLLEKIENREVIASWKI